MANRTRSGNLQLADLAYPDRSLTVDIGRYPAAIGLLAVDRETDERVFVVLDAEQLGELVDEVLRFRSERGI